MKKLPPLEEREDGVLLGKIFIGAVILCFGLFTLLNFILLFFGNEEGILQITFRGAQIVDTSAPDLTPVWIQKCFQGALSFITLSFAGLTIIPSFRELQQRKQAASSK